MPDPTPPVPLGAWQFQIGRLKCPECGGLVMVLGPAVQLEIRKHPERDGKPTTPTSMALLHKKCGMMLELRLRAEAPSRVSPLPAARETR